MAATRESMLAALTRYHEDLAMLTFTRADETILQIQALPEPELRELFEKTFPPQHQIIQAFKPPDRNKRFKRCEDYSF